MSLSLIPFAIKNLPKFCLFSLLPHQHSKDYPPMLSTFLPPPGEDLSFSQDQAGSRIGIFLQPTLNASADSRHEQKHWSQEKSGKIMDV